MFGWFVFGCGVLCAQNERIPGWQPEVREEFYPSSADGTLQPTLLYDPRSKEPAPLLVALHTWGGNHKQAEPAYSEWCIRKGWVFVHPEFRGANTKPSACGSELVVQDILSVVEWAKQKTLVDPKRIYLIGASGGGYASMLMAGRAPEVWAGVSAWCGIFDLRDWHAKHRGGPYGRAIEAACGGAPGTDSLVDEEYRKRSASAWLENAKGLPVDINAGIFDGHKGSVPVSHSLKAFNVLSDSSGRVTEAEISLMTEKPEVPEELLFKGMDPLYKKWNVLFRRISQNSRVTLFQGGHEIVHVAGLAWLEQQRKGQAAVWEVPVSEMDLSDKSTESGK